MATSMASMASTSSSFPNMHDICCVTKAMPINFIDKLKSYRTTLTNHTVSVSHHIKPLVINALGSERTQTHILTCDFKKLGACWPAGQHA